MLLMLLVASKVKAAENETFWVLITKVPEQYVFPLEIEQNAIWVFKSIKALDKNLLIADDNDKVTLYYKGKIIKSIYKPQNRNDTEYWANIGAELLDLAFEKSAKAAKKDFEAIDIMMNEYVRNLDKDTKYYANVDEVDRPLHQINFADRRENENLWIKIGNFDKYTKDKIMKSLSENEDIKGVILDLRGSHGGQLATAIEVADLFLDEGIVVSVVGRNSNEVVYYNSADGDLSEGKPMVVLVDGDTASAAEVLAMALQEQGRAKIVGTKSFGKGIIQNLINLPNGGVLALSNATLYTPSGKKLSDVAIVPDICTFEMPEDKNIKNLLALPKDEICLAEARLNSDLEIKIANELLKM